MEAKSIYKFKHCTKPDSKTVYLFESLQGEEIPNFLEVYKRGFKDYGIAPGTKKIRFGKCQTEEQEKAGFDRCIYNVTGIYLSETNPHIGYGDGLNIKNNDCIIIEFSDDFERLTVYFIENMANQSNVIFSKFENGEIIKIAKSNLLLINEKAVNQID